MLITQWLWVRIPWVLTQCNFCIWYIFFLLSPSLRSTLLRIRNLEIKQNFIRQMFYLLPKFSIAKAITHSWAILLLRCIQTGIPYPLLSPILREMLVGLFLGVLHAEKQCINSNTRLQFRQGLINELYLLHLYSFFKPYCGSTPKILNSRVSAKTGKPIRVFSLIP